MTELDSAISQGEPDLVARALAGEAGAFERLYAAHAGRVRAYLVRCGFRGDDVDDLTQETFVNAFRSLETFDPQRGCLRAWLGAIARNVARKRWSSRPQWDMFDPELAEAMFPAADDPPADVETREQFLAVRDCVEALPPELANLVRLRYQDGRTTRSISAATGMPEATVRLRLQEARAMLGRCLRGKGILE